MRRWCFGAAQPCRFGIGARRFDVRATWLAMPTARAAIN
jgi:hypothetical protein